jgi:peptidoglycan/LPS O-acetylase OafA/YrhL
MSTDPTRRFLALDSVRGLCACLVALGHFATASPYTEWSIARNSYLFVDFFFILSGFVICWNYAHRLSSWLDVRHFAVLRLGRLYPLHITVLAGFVTLEFVGYFLYPHLLNHPPFGPTNAPAMLVPHVLLVQGFATQSAMTWHIPGWSISVELWTYALFAAVCLFARARLASVAAAGVAAVAMVAFVRTTNFTESSLGRCLLGFGLGVLCCLAFRQVKWRPSRSMASAIEVMALSAIAVVVAGVVSPWFAPWAMSLAVLVCATERGIVSQVLLARPMVELGRLSYSIYMVHTLAINGFWIATNLVRSKGLDLWGLKLRTAHQVYGRDALEGLLFMVAFLTAVVALSAFTFRYIEQPGRDWSRRYAKSLRRITARSAPVTN